MRTQNLRPRNSAGKAQCIRAGDITLISIRRCRTQGRFSLAATAARFHPPRIDMRRDEMHIQAVGVWPKFSI
jgi:hypothetical protein